MQVKKMNPNFSIKRAGENISPALSLLSSIFTSEKEEKTV
jgi:hypothetical protein